MTLERRLAGGVRVNLIANIATFGAQAAMMAVLARLLHPSEYGVVAAALIIVKPVQQILFNGLEQSAVLQTEMPPRATTTLFWMSAVFAVGGVAILMVIAQLLPIPHDLQSATMGLSFVLLGPALAIAPRVMLRRQMAFGKLAIVETAATVIGFGAVSIGCALAGLGAMSLVYGYVGQTLVRAAGCFAYCPGCVDGWVFDFPAVRPTVSMGARITSVSLLEIIQAQLPSSFIAAYFGAAPLGQFSQSLSLIATPIQLISQSMTKVASTSFRIVRSDVAQLRQSCGSLMATASAITVPICFGMAATAGPLVLVVLGPQWAPASRIAPWLAIGAACRVLAHVLAVMNEAAWRLNEKFLIQVVTIVATVGAFLFAVHGGLRECAQAYSFASFVYLAGQAILSARILRTGAVEMIGWIVPACVCSALIYLGVLILNTVCAVSSPYLQLGLDMAFCGAILTGLYAICFPRLRRDFLLLAGFG